MVATTTSPSCLDQAQHDSRAGAISLELQRLIRGQLSCVLRHAIDAESEALCHASAFQRCETRTAHRTGSSRRRLQSRCGEIALSVPRLSLADHHPAMLPRCSRSIDHLIDAAICLTAGHNTWSAIQGLLAPLRSRYGESEWSARLAQRLLQHAERARRSVLPIKASGLNICGVVVAPCERPLPPMTCISLDAGPASTTWLTVIEQGDAQAWSRFALDLRQRGLLKVERICGLGASPVADAVRRCWPQASFDDAPAPRITL